MSDELGSNTLLGCGFKVTKGEAAASEQGPHTLFTPISAASSLSSKPSVEALLQDQNWLKDELSEVKAALSEEKALNAKHHEDLLNVISALMAKLSILPP